MRSLTPEQVGTCYVHDKILFRDRKTARMNARRTVPRDGRMNAFKCEAHPGLWHLGHLPEPIVRGVRGRDWINNLSTSRTS